MPLSDESKIEEIMKRTSLHAYLATCDGDLPTVRPVSPIVETCTRIYIATSRKSRKMEHIRGNPRVSLAFVEMPRGDKAATVTGRASVVEKPEDRRRLWNAAGFDLSVRFPDGLDDEDLCFLRIHVERIEWRDRWEGGLRTYEPGVKPAV